MLRTTPRAILTLESQFFTYNITVPKNADVLAGPVFNVRQLLACMVLSHPISKKSSRIKFASAPVSSTRLTGYILLALGTTEIDTL